MKITFDDGTILIVDGGGPTSGALAGQAGLLLGAYGAVASAPTIWQATVAAFKHLGRETAEAIADGVVQELTGLPVGPSGLLPKKGKVPEAKATRPKRGRSRKPSATASNNPRNKLRRPKLQKATRDKIENAAEKTPEGKFISATNGKVIEGKFHYGHIKGREHRRLVAQAEQKGMTQKQFDEWVNSHPEWFQIEDPGSNLSHRYEKPGND